MQTQRPTGTNPEQKLQFLSYLDDLQLTRPLYPVTPERSNKGWVMDAWQDDLDCVATSPQKQKYINRIITSQQKKSARASQDKSPLQLIKMGTPQLKKSTFEEVQKENKPKTRSRLYSVPKQGKRLKEEQVAAEQTFKVPLSSVVYPLLRDSNKRSSSTKRYRIQRFHSFITRTVRRC